MAQKSQFSFRKGDLFAIVLVAILAAGTALAFIPRNNSAENSVVQIVQDGKLVHEISLRENTSLQLSGPYSNTISVQDGRAAITQSTCPGEDCVHSGWISQPGRSIVCLPNRVEVRITGASDVDFVVG